MSSFIGVENCNIPLRCVLIKGLRVLGHASGTREDILDAFEYVCKQLVQCNVKVLPLEQVNAAMDRLHSGQAVGRLVLDLTEEAKYARLGVLHVALPPSIDLNESVS